MVWKEWFGKNGQIVNVPSTNGNCGINSIIYSQMKSLKHPPTRQQREDILKKFNIDGFPMSGGVSRYNYEHFNSKNQLHPVIIYDFDVIGKLKDISHEALVAGKQIFVPPPRTMPENAEPIILLLVR